MARGPVQFLMREWWKGQREQIQQKTFFKTPYASWSPFILSCFPPPSLTSPNAAEFLFFMSSSASFQNLPPYRQREIGSAPKCTQRREKWGNLKTQNPTYSEIRMTPLQRLPPFPKKTHIAGARGKREEGKGEGRILENDKMAHAMRISYSDNSRG